MADEIGSWFFKAGVVFALIAYGVGTLSERSPTGSFLSFFTG